MTTTLSVKDRMELMNMELRAKKMTMEDRYLECKKLGLPSELIAAFVEMSAKTAQTVLGKTIEAGKIIIDKVIDFIKLNPNMAIGAVIGAAVGALGHLIPFIGPLIGPITTFAGAAAGAIGGHRIDKINKGETVIDGAVGVLNDLISMAKEFFKLIADIFNAILDKNIGFSFN